MGKFISHSSCRHPLRVIVFYDYNSNHSYEKIVQNAQLRVEFILPKFLYFDNALLEKSWNFCDDHFLGTSSEG